MKLVKRVEVLSRLGQWLQNNDDYLKSIKKAAFDKNKWFTEEFVDHRIAIIISNLLNPGKLEQWINHYHLDDNIQPQKIGIVMAGNIPLVGFHDFLCAFITGHRAFLKLSEKDSVLFKAIVEKMIEFDKDVNEHIQLSDMLKGANAYIATGSNNTSRYFDYYFGKYPSIIRKNKTSVAVLNGEESDSQLSLLADDVFLYFGLGCRSVTQLYIPHHFNFEVLLNSFKKYNYLRDHAKFKDNYDYNLALLIMNNRQYMTNDCIVMVEGDHLFSPVSELYYSFYDNPKKLNDSLLQNNAIQSVVGNGYIDFGKSQDTGLFDYTDGVDTMQFLLGL